MWKVKVSQIEQDSERTKLVNWMEHEENIFRDWWVNTYLVNMLLEFLMSETHYKYALEC